MLRDFLSVSEEFFFFFYKYKSNFQNFQIKEFLHAQLQKWLFSLEKSMEEEDNARIFSNSRK